MVNQAELLKVATAMLDKAYTPYSHFHVGAAVVGESGKVYGGCNIENASYGATNCAERTAIFSGIAAGERHFQAILVTGNTDGPIAPCGICRQVIAEFFDQDAPVYLTNQRGAVAETTVAGILPGAFVELK
ncbi:cytidine deaminase [Levilactobacillus suantsaii]|uniref:Cytidine deaminase n=1 Tax=Levilactobacillus suantsaii TaxID=2292255 RepID=A0A4Q0VHW8_9LACO|nr:cytidine deaminase [Levilactobacillus suantsaii]QMU08923.1 cytidine deaminase [Levilactobacillus suantsaii]RXI78214.1 cytidine deaminase [Levilactobacillus suantsaii]